jgi:hypothetical protein
MGRENLRVTEEKAVVIGVGTPLYHLKSTILLKLRLKGLNIAIYTYSYSKTSIHVLLLLDNDYDKVRVCNSS